ncbi:MAG: hypothetical protein OSP8Acid_00640 [uncultured Acidilobus sp. OSP8]|nr:MAG: hypothetical protein OSP8Acid_00640 [uncultured Acidilobus sp. OSP8]
MLIRCRNGIYVSVGVCNGVKGANGDAHCLVYLRPAEGGVKPLASAGQSTSTVQGSRSRRIYATIAVLMDVVLAFLLFQLKNPANDPYLAAAIAVLTGGVAIFEAKSSSRSQRTVVTSVFTSREELCRAEGVEFTAITSAELLLRESRGGVKQVRVSLANGARATIHLTDKELEELRSHIALSPTPTY